MPVERVAEVAASFGASHVVITGGEPMIAAEITELSRRLRQAKVHITIETAGTFYVQVACDLMSISPKLGNSTPHEREDGRWAAQHERLRFQPEVLRQLVREYDYQLKFVVCGADDLEEVEAIRCTAGADRERTILMPEGTDRELLRERGIWLAEICKSKGYRYSPRLQIDLWGDRRGV